MHLEHILSSYRLSAKYNGEWSFIKCDQFVLDVFGIIVIDCYNYRDIGLLQSICVLVYQRTFASLLKVILYRLRMMWWSLQHEIYDTHLSLCTDLE